MVYVAVLPTSVRVPRTTPASLKMTDPLGAGEAASAGVTVAVKTTDAPAFAEACNDATAVEVVIGSMVCAIAAEVLAWSFVSPL